MKKENKARLWTNEEVKFLKKNYKKMSLEELAKALNRNRGSVSIKASRIGISRKQWSEEEIDYLKKNWYKKDNEYLAKKLKRSVIAIDNKASYLGLGAKMEWYSLSEVAEMFNVSKMGAYRWYREGIINCIASPLKTNALMVSETDIKEFAKNNTGKWRTKECGIVVSMWERKPQWLKDKIQYEENNITCKKYKWTKFEEWELYKMYVVENRSFTYICNKLNRDFFSVKSKCYRLRLNRTDRMKVKESIKEYGQVDYYYKYDKLRYEERSKRG